jgi:hypothetical protein
VNNRPSVRRSFRVLVPSPHVPGRPPHETKKRVGGINVALSSESSLLFVEHAQIAVAFKFADERPVFMSGGERFLERRGEIRAWSRAQGNQRLDFAPRQAARIEGFFLGHQLTPLILSAVVAAKAVIIRKTR